MSLAAPHTFLANEVATATNINTLSGWYASKPQCIVRATAFAHATSGSWLATAFSADVLDTDTMHDTVTNNSRITFTTAGLYLVQANVQFDTGTTGLRGLRIQRNALGLGVANGTVEEVKLATNQVAADGTCMSLTQLFKMTAADYVELTLYQTQGAGITVVGAQFTATWQSA